ncbi:hypothetical protein AG1IA_06989 [Rhizoctonia solani AG-1 IA]|uniref:Uncharacterized protein n=1 Tax=Thanatephorus cucumeris (strain AG1-IA) TaxID=983506 RepID=L8WQC7_THACA|nr:hypothetical protein AG1IA_06989 [Rhizoctonia solani AG-1 IA]
MIQMHLQGLPFGYWSPRLPHRVHPTHAPWRVRSLAYRAEPTLIALHETIPGRSRALLPLVGLGAVACTVQVAHSLVLGVHRPDDRAVHQSMRTHRQIPPEEPILFLPLCLLGILAYGNEIVGKFVPFPIRYSEVVGSFELHAGWIGRRRTRKGGGYFIRTVRFGWTWDLCAWSFGC